MGGARVQELGPDERKPLLIEFRIGCLQVLITLSRRQRHNSVIKVELREELEDAAIEARWRSSLKRGLAIGGISSKIRVQFSNSMPVKSASITDLAKLKSTTTLLTSIEPLPVLPPSQKPSLSNREFRASALQGDDAFNVFRCSHAIDGILDEQGEVPSNSNWLKTTLNKAINLLLYRRFSFSEESGFHDLGLTTISQFAPMNSMDRPMQHSKTTSQVIHVPTNPSAHLS